MRILKSFRLAALLAFISIIAAFLAVVIRPALNRANAEQYLLSVKYAEIEFVWQRENIDEPKGGLASIFGIQKVPPIFKVASFDSGKYFDCENLAALSEVEEIVIEGKGFLNLDSLESLAQLHYLYLSNADTNITADGRNSTFKIPDSVRKLVLSNFRHAKVGPASNLEELVLSGYRHFSLDSFKTKKLVSLTLRECNNELNLLDNIPFADLASLSITSNSNELKLEGITRSDKIKELTLRRCQFEDTNWISRLDRMESLSFNRVPLDSYDFLRSLPNLKKLHIGNSRLEFDCSLISELPIEELELFQTPIVNYKSLQSIKGLKRLTLTLSGAMDFREIPKIHDELTDLLPNCEIDF